MSDPQIPVDARTELCQLALDAQKACLELFDAIEAGPLVEACLAHLKTQRALTALGENLRVFAALELSRSRLLPQGAWPR